MVRKYSSHMDTIQASRAILGQDFFEASGVEPIDPNCEIIFPRETEGESILNPSNTVLWSPPPICSPRHRISDPLDHSMNTACQAPSARHDRPPVLQTPPLGEVSAPGHHGDLPVVHDFARLTPFSCALSLWSVSLQLSALSFFLLHCRLSFLVSPGITLFLVAGYSA